MAIDSKDNLKKEIGIDDFTELEQSDKLKRFIELFKKKEISESLARDVIASVPGIASAFTELLKTMGGIGSSLEETKRSRWLFLTELAKSSLLSGEQVIEAMKIIQEIEKNESIDWDSIFKGALVVVGILAGIAIWVATGGKVEPKNVFEDS